MIRRSDRAMARTLDDEVIILDVPSGRYFGLNEVGGFIWTLLEHPTDRETLVDAVTTAFDVDRGTAAEDLDALLTELVDAGLVVEAS